MTGISFTGRVLVPIADPDDAVETARALGPYLDDATVVAVHVIEKAGGAPDKASVEQREGYAEAIFDAFREQLPDAETETRFGTDVAGTIFETAAEVNAGVVVLTPRGGSRWVRLLTGDVALSLVTDVDRPVVVLPEASDRPGADEADVESATDGTTGSSAPSDDGTGGSRK